jgi:hypothetical protein
MNYLEKTHESYNFYYKLYKADWCRKSGLPMYAKKDWPTVEENELYTITRAKKAKVQIDINTVCAWYRMPNGYTPLFKTTPEEVTK